LDSGLLKSTRLSATVTISHPEAVTAFFIISPEENFPVPTKIRELNSLPEIISLSKR
jgi:hypothetical protein